MDIASSDTYDVSVLLQEQTANYTQGGIAAIGTGTQYVDASYAGDATRLASNFSSVPLTGTALLTQTINFSPIASPVTFGVSPIYLSATGGNSGNPVTFSVLSGPGYISGNSLNVTGAGTIVVAANQAGNADYSAAPQVTQAVVVNKSGSGQGYTLSWSTPSNITYGTPLSTTQLDATSTIPGSFAYNYPAGSVLSAGSYVLLATFTPTDSADYNAGTINTTLTVVPATPVLSWAPTPLITYGTPLGPPELNATSNVPGTFVYTPSPGTVLPVGLYELQATFYPTDATDYNSGTVDALLRVATVSTVISVNCAPNPITYGPQTSTCTATVSAGATGNVNFFYNGTPWANNVPIVGGAASATGFSNMPAGSYVVAADYSGDSNFSAASTSTTLTIGQASPAVTLSCYPTSFTLGSTTTCTASVPVSDGTVAFFSTADLTGKWWNAAFPAGGGDLGTTPAATTQDAALNYNISGESWPNAVAGPAGVNTTNIYARWTGTFVSPVDGTYTIGVNSDDGANVYVNGTLLVANLSTGQAAASNLTYTQSGQIPLSAGATNTIVVEYEQGGGEAGIQLLWTPPGAGSASLLGWTVVPVDADGIASITGGSPWTAGTYNVNAVYSGDTNYASTSSNVVQVTVTQATPTVTVTCSPNTIVFGATTSCTAHVSSGTGTVSFTGGASQPGPWVETVDGSGNAVLTGFTNWAAGTYTLQATYSGDTNYNGATGSGTLTITQAAAGLAWATPAAITYGTPLSATQLDATSGGIAGTFAYTPAAGTVLPAGNQVLSVTFTPTDTTDYSTQTTTVNLLVNKAPLTVTPNPVTRAYGAANPAFSGTITGLVGGDVITPTYSSAAIATTPVGVYATGPIGVTDGLSDPNGKLVNYTLTQNTGTFTITQATPGLTWATPAPITYGTPLSATQLNATSGGVAGTFAYSPAAGTILTPGSQLLSVIFTPTDTTDYQSQSASVALTVNKATLTITPNPASKIFGAANPTFTGTVTGLVSGDTILIGYTSSATTTTPVGVYSSGPDAISYTSAGPVNELGYYNYVASLGTLTITQQSPVLTWATPAAITYGTPLSATQLNASSGGVAGTFVYSPAAGTVLPAGSQTLSVTFTPTDSADYSVQTATVTLLVNKAPLTVTPNPVSRSYGVANPAFTGAVAGLVNGDTITATYASAATSSTAVGVYSSGPNAIAATLSDPGNKLPNYSLTQSMGTLTITQATTTLTWATPAAITYGTPLSATQLDATSGGVAGTFVYTPAAGTVLPAGSQLLSVTFTPTDGADYSAASATVTLTVNKAPLTVTPNPASKVYGTANPAFTGSITGLVAGDTITATYASGATATTAVGVYSSGVDAIAATLSDPGNKLGNYTLTQNLGTLTITQATTTLTWATPAPITYGTALSSTQLDATSGGVAGTFVYTPAAGTVLAAGTQTLSVTFTPTDLADYSSQTATVSLTVNKAPLTVTPNNVSRLYGVANPAFTGSIAGLVAGDSITATYASAANLTTVVGVYSSGPNAIAATLSDPGSKLGNYTLTQNLGTLTITQTTTTLTWATPAAITYGTSLSATQLNATSGGIAGTFVYTPPAGTVLPVGSQTLSVVFTPTDSADYSDATDTVTLTVNKAPLTVTPNAASKVYGTANPAFTGSVTGLVAGDTITATYASGATTTTGVGVYSTGVNAIAATLSDPGNRLGNYTLTQNLGTLTITQAATTLTWPTPAAITYGTPLSATQLNATSVGVAGTFVYSPAAGAILAAGSQTLSVMFTPTDTADYGSQIATVNLQVNKAALVVTPNPASRLYAAANPVFTGTITGMIAGDGIFATYASAANATTPVGTYSAGSNAIASTLIDPGSKLANYTVTQNLGTLTITQVTTNLTWATPAAISYGTTLSAAQLDATSGGVAGVFVYSPAAGTVLSAGSHTLSVTFTPTDGFDYSTATASVTLTVNPAILTVTPAPSSKVYGTANPVFTGSISGMIPGDGISATYSSAATTATVVGVYSSGPNAIAATLSDPGNKLGNYTLVQTAGAFAITQATTVLTWATPASISYETPLSSTQLDATSGGVAGTFVYTPAAGTILSAGSHTLSVAFTPTDAADYSSATATVTLTVTKTTPTVVLTSSPNPSVYGGLVTITATTNAAATGTVIFYDGGSVLGPGTITGGVAIYALNSLGGGTHSITASYAGDSNYLSAVSAALSQVVTKSPVTITVTSSVNPSNFGQSVTFTFTVTGVAGLATPTGSIAFTDGGTLIASPVLNPLGVAAYTTVTLSGGSHSLAAVYGGDANYQ
jgi:hypothetical protein